MGRRLFNAPELHFYASLMAVLSYGKYISYGATNACLLV